MGFVAPYNCLGKAEEDRGISLNEHHPPMPKRVGVLLALWKRTQWLDTLINKMEDPNADAVENVREMVYDCQVFAQLCKTVLYGLKDQELDALAVEVEEIKKHVGMIPK